MSSSIEAIRKIIHVDMDCFYAAIEIRDNPELADKPVAVGGHDKRGVLCTCNYIARKYGIHSAMPSTTALRLCKDLIILPVNMAKYKEAARHIKNIFLEITDKVEPLSLDEAYLDVSESMLFDGSATRIAEYIRERIWDSQHLTASAGVAPNKFLAKIASGWKKPNGLFVVRPAEISAFVAQLKVTNLHGVGKVTAEKLHRMNIETCADLQQFTLVDLVKKFDKFGQQLFYQSRGIDLREVIPNRIRKSLSVENTYADNIMHVSDCREHIADLQTELSQRLQRSAPNRIVKSVFVKLKFFDFKTTTAEIGGGDTNVETFYKLLLDAYQRHQKPIRLLGVGVRFIEERIGEDAQISFAL